VVEVEAEQAVGSMKPGVGSWKSVVYEEWNN